jgi:UDPglucose--hexose-1-phosphate uridylyltransferase
LGFRDRILDLKRDNRLRYVLLFKNHGEAAGASLEHTHSQIIALPVVPIQVQEELDSARRYYSFKERCVFCDIVRQESADGERMILESDQLLVISPYAPRFPFETWVVPRARTLTSKALSRVLFRAWHGPCAPSSARWKRSWNIPHTTS